MESLLEEVKELATRNEELLSSKDDDMNTIKELEQQASDYRKKYERAKTELRSLKGMAVKYNKAAYDLTLYVTTSHIPTVLAKAEDRGPTSNFSWWCYHGFPYHGMANCSGQPFISWTVGLSIVAYSSVV
jgi:hypothetical protein